MCILFIDVNPNPEKNGHRLILAANRDEFYKRPSMSAYVDKYTNIIGGRDMEPGKEGGTWLAFRSKDQDNGNGKKYCVASILNVTGAKVENPSGRGHIITDYLLTNKDFSEYVNILDKALFDGYNFIAVELSKDEAIIYHHGNTPQINSSYCGKHTLGFGNSPIFSPLNKVKAGKNSFEKILKKKLSGEDLERELLKMLKDETKHLPDDELQKRQPTWYAHLSSVFVKYPGYGTRTHTLILIDYDWNLRFIEHTLKEPIDINNLDWKETRLNLVL